MGNNILILDINVWRYMEKHASHLLVNLVVLSLLEPEYNLHATDTLHVVLAASMHDTFPRRQHAYTSLVSP